MKRSVLFFSALLFCCASCSESDPATTPEAEYKQAEIYLTTGYQMTGSDRGALEGFYLITGFDGTEECRLSEETYASFQMYSDNNLKFIGDYADAAGTLHMTKENIFIWKNDYGHDVLDYDYFQELPTAASGEGIYHFALKFYQPHTNTCFITRPYQLKLWLEDKFLRTEIHVLNQLNN